MSDCAVTELERSVLGAMLVDTQLAVEALEVVRQKDWGSEQHRLIAEAIEDLVGEGAPADVVSVPERLRSLGRLESAGGVSYVCELTEAVPDATAVGYYAQLIRAASIRRRLLVLSGEALDAGKGAASGDELDAELGRIMASVADLIRESTGRRGGARCAREVAGEVISTAEAIATGGVSGVGIATGMTQLDDVLGGLRPGGVYLLTADTSVGKTALALQIADNAAESGAVVVYYSLEMGAEELAGRVLASRSGISSHLLVNGKLSEFSAAKLRHTAEAMPAGRLWIDDAGALTVLEIAARCRGIGTRGRVGLIVVDYLQLVSPATRGRNREQEVAEISRGLKALAKEAQAAVLALSQVNDESRARESRALEHDADVVLLLERQLGEAESKLTVRKNRQGPAGGRIRLHFDGVRQRFSATEERRVSQWQQP